MGGSVDIRHSGLIFSIFNIDVFVGADVVEVQVFPV